MATPIAFELTAESKQMYTALLRQEKRVDTLQRKLDKVGHGGAASMSRVGSEVKGLVLGLVGANGLTAAVQTVVSHVKQAYDTMLEQQRKALDRMGAVADAKARFMYNAAGMPGGKQAAEAMARNVATTAGVELETVYDILATGISAGGRGQQLESGAILAAQMQQRGLGEGKDIIGAALDLSNITGRPDAQSNFAFMRQIGASSRAVSLESQMNLVRALTTGRALGDNPEQVAELTAAVNLAMKDTEGSLTGTGVTNLLTQLASDQLVRSPGGELRKLQGGTAMERIADLQNSYQGADESERDAIVQRLGGRAAMKPIMRMIAENSQDWQAILAERQRQITAPGDPAALADFAQMMTDTAGGDEAVTSGRRRAGAALARSEAGRPREAAQAAIRQIGAQYLQQQGMEGSLVAGAATAGETAVTIGGSNLVSPALPAPIAAATAGIRQAMEGGRIWGLLTRAFAGSDENSREIIDRLDQLITVARGTGPAPQAQEVD